MSFNGRRIFCPVRRQSSQTCPLVPASSRDPQEHDGEDEREGAEQIEGRGHHRDAGGVGVEAEPHGGERAGAVG